MRILITALAIGLAAAGTARAQSGNTAWRDHGCLSINGEYQAASSSFQNSLSMPLFLETESVGTTYKKTGAPGFDASGGVRIWRNLAAGVAVTYFTKSHSADVTASIPHPFFFNRARQTTGVAPGVQHDETAVHISAVWVAPVSAKWQISAFGGPSFFNVNQGFVTSIAYSDSYPYDTATFANASVQRQSKSKIGAHGGIDLAFMFSRRVGAGFVARYSHATVRFATTGGTVNVDAGGAQVGAGLRFRF